MASSITDLVVELVLAFPDNRSRDESIPVYVRHLSDVPVDELAAAVTDAITTGDRFPTIAQLRRAVAERRLRLPSTNDALSQAEERVVWANRQGIEADPGDPPPIHPLVLECLNLVGGAHAIRSSEKPSVQIGQFRHAYEAARDDAIRAAMVPTQRAIGAA